MVTRTVLENKLLELRKSLHNPSMSDSLGCIITMLIDELNLYTYDVDNSNDAYIEKHCDELLTKILFAESNIKETPVAEENLDFIDDCKESILGYQIDLWSSRWVLGLDSSM